MIVKNEKNQINSKHPYRKNKWLIVILCAVIIIIAFFSVSYITIWAAFHPSQAANLPCRNLTNASEALHINGFDLWYRENGIDGVNPPIVILHGGPGMSSCYFQDSFKFLEDEYQVIYYDQRGSGFSQIKPELEYYTFDQLVLELEALMEEKICEEKVILIGHSFGGLLAMKYAIDYEDHVDKMILVSSVPVKERGSEFDIELILNYGLPPSDPEEADAWLLNALPFLFRHSFYDEDNSSLLDPGYASFATMIAVSESIHDYDYSAELQYLGTETLIVYGESEDPSTLEEGQFEIHNLLQNSTIMKFKECGHWCFLEKPDLFQQTIMNFLKSESG